MSRPSRDRPSDAAARDGDARPGEEPTRSRWLSLLAMTRLLAAVVAVVLLVVHRVSPHDPALIVAGVAWTAASLFLFARHDEWQRRPEAWALDAAVALTLVWLSDDWRSPFYVFTLTTLILPATTLSFRGAVLWGCGFTAAYFAVAIATEVDTGTLRSSIRVETVATHLMVPVVVTLALAYAAELLERLRAERQRGERLAIEAERRRIAWDLHDSAKQRIHAAHLVLSATAGQTDEAARSGIDHALTELRAAAADLDTSVAELRAPLDNRPVDELLRRRAAELDGIAGTRIELSGALPAMPPLIAAHAYRIAAEALTNAIRHGRADRIEVRMDPRPEGPTVVVADDGVGFPADARPGSHGIRFMRTRAETIGGRLEIGRRDADGGTVVTLVLPPIRSEGDTP